MLTYGEIPATADWTPPKGDVERRARLQRIRGPGRYGRVPSIATVYKVFGSFGAAIEAAGFTARPPGVPVHPRRPERCKHGHRYTPENTYTYPDGHRACRKCRRVAHHRHRPPKGREKRTHCIRGHRFTRANTYVSPDGFRHCRACARLRKQARRLGLLINVRPS